MFIAEKLQGTNMYLRELSQANRHALQWSYDKQYDMKTMSVGLCYWYTLLQKGVKSGASN